MRTRTGNKLAEPIYTISEVGLQFANRMLTTPDADTTQQAADKILGIIIDSWYENVASFYITSEQVANLPDQQGTEELKRFHDEKGHRIKFNKGDLDFTYGLRSSWLDDVFILEVSVNNKVESFDYDDFLHRLAAHYRHLGAETVPAPFELKEKNLRYNQIFLLKPSVQDAFAVERRGEGADIMRLSFRVGTPYLEHCFRPKVGKQLIENYCVSPLRSVFAAVYRRRSN